MKRRCCHRGKKFHDGNNIEPKYTYICIHESRVILKEPLKFSARIFEEGFSLSTKGGEGGECIALHAVKRYPQRFVSYIYVYKVSYNLGMRGGKDEFAIHVPRGVFGADSSRKFLAKSSPPGFVKRRPLIWKLHATPTSFQNDQLQIRPRSIYHRLAIFNRNSFPSGFWDDISESFSMLLK